MKYLFPTAFGLALAVFPIACAILPVPTDESAVLAAQQWPDATLAGLQTGRHLYIQNCASCHQLHWPNEYLPERWEVILDKMQPKARIDDPTKDLILRYLMTSSLQAATH